MHSKEVCSLCFASDSSSAIASLLSHPSFSVPKKLVLDYMEYLVHQYENTLPKLSKAAP